MAEETSSEQFLNPSRRSSVYESSRGSSNRTRIILIIIGVIILIGLVAFAIFATGGKGEEGLEPSPSETVNETTNTDTTTETPTPTTETTPTEKPTPTGSEEDLKREDLTIEIQNGSGVAGAATKASDYLKGLGYNISSTGNADNFEYEEAEIQISSDKEEYLDMLKEDLEKEYTVGSATSDYDGSADALVIVGAE